MMVPAVVLAGDEDLQVIDATLYGRTDRNERIPDGKPIADVHLRWDLRLNVYVGETGLPDIILHGATADRLERIGRLLVEGAEALRTEAARGV